MEELSLRGLGMGVSMLDAVQYFILAALALARAT